MRKVLVFSFGDFEGRGGRGGGGVESNLQAQTTVKM